jgi:hypothetical protein
MMHFRAAAVAVRMLLFGIDRGWVNKFSSLGVGNII